MRLELISAVKSSAVRLRSKVMARNFAGRAGLAGRGFDKRDSYTQGAV